MLLPLAASGVRDSRRRAAHSIWRAVGVFRELGFPAHQWSASVRMPRIGCGLAGGEWEKAEPLIVDPLPTLTNHKVVPHFRLVAVVERADCIYRGIRTS
jgi:O-acetyl-ADP-ribose deacetylase (regulator of RNase III)